MKGIQTHSRLTRAVAGLACLAALGGCDATAIVDPGQAAQEEAAAKQSAVKAAHELDPAVLDMLITAIQDEFYLEALYGRVILDLGEIKPFTRVVDAEGRHVTALVKRFTFYGEDVPPPDWNTGNVPTYDTRLAACAAAVEVENANVAMYDLLLLSTDLPEKIRSVFESLREASLDNHVAAFTRCK